MCYHASTPEKKALKALLEKEIKIGDYNAYYHTSGFEHKELPVMLMKEPDKIQAATWGFIPAWAKPVEAPALMNKTLNARAETIFTTPMFRSAAPGHRCLVFVNGFFEWKHEKVGGKLRKMPHYIQMPEHRPFALGGLYSHWIDKASGEVLTTCNIITTPANELMASIHNTKKRMPLILDEDVWGLWLAPEAKQKEVQGVMKHYPEGYLEAHEISNLITSRNGDANVPEVQEPI